MKTIFYAILFTFLVINLKAQWAPEGATWHYGEEFAFSGDIDFMTFVAEGDTIIQGITCQKIKKYGQVFCMGRPSMEFTYEENGKIFYYNPDHEEFEILYDFTAEPGDSWMVYSFDVSSAMEDTILVLVDSFDTININGFDLKRLYVNYQYDFPFYNEFSIPTIIIEKFGDIQYMFNFYTRISLVCDGNYSTGLRCYEDNVFGLYESGIADSCTYGFVWTGTSEIQNNEKITISPNPASGVITVKSELKTPLGKYIIYNIDGKLLQKGLVTNDQIFLKGIKNGVYILQLFSINDKLLSSNKLLKF